ncbi:MAG: hypothetical protein JWP66_1351 [Naasia sp.]|nr:hypothetical protein [Naasia sp.]
MAVPKWATRLARKRAARAADERRRTPLDPALADQVDEGVLIATSAVRLAAKNDLILRALRDGDEYDAGALAGAVRAELLALAEEKVEDARRVESVRRSVRRRFGVPRHQHDYRRADRAPLEKREQVNAALAVRLRALSEDDDYIRDIVARARDAALDEIAYSMRDKARALYNTAMVDEDYEVARELRMQMIAHDLNELERTRGARWV